MTNDLIEAKAALAEARQHLEEQQAKWPIVNEIRAKLERALEENHFTERIRAAQAVARDRP